MSRFPVGCQFEGLTRHSVNELLFGPSMFGEDQRQIVDRVLVWLLCLEVLKRSKKLLFHDFESFRAKGEIKHLIQNLLQQYSLLVTVAAD